MPFIKLPETYNHNATIAISVFLFMTMLLTFVMQVVRWRNDYDDYVSFNNPGTEMFAVESVSLIYSFAFVILQTQVQKFSFAESDAVFHIVVMFCAGFTLVWTFGFISALVAYFANVILWLFFGVNAIQSLLLPYALYRFRSHENDLSASNNQSVGPLSRLSADQQVKLLQEMETMRKKLESIELENQPQSNTWSYESAVKETTRFPVQDPEQSVEETFIAGPAPRRRVEFRIDEPKPIPPRRRSPSYSLL
ncbi:hypothetical protein M3Y96_01069700 [Aphelenchoides besseyi]|nr:hypothetical protein M3Y96_01069700 [Aphelenchoides besseyi]